jgi:hypothetical protein
VTVQRFVRAVIAVSTALGVFCAFGWPYVFGFEPASAAFHAVAIATLIAWFASLAVALAAKR